MPELPEVETTRRGLAPHLEGRRVIGVTLRRPDLRWPIPQEIETLLPSQTILSIRRRAKYLLMETEAGSALWHLGMSGSLRVLPSKTWEGLIGGVVSATVLGAALHGITPFTALEAALVALVICLMGFFGGLVMSAIKRDRGVKDWGSMIEGHGGILDRVDSVVFAAPIFFHMVRYGWI